MSFLLLSLQAEAQSHTERPNEPEVYRISLTKDDQTNQTLLNATFSLKAKTDHTSRFYIEDWSRSFAILYDGRVNLQFAPSRFTTTLSLEPGIVRPRETFNGSATVGFDLPAGAYNLTWNFQVPPTALANGSIDLLLVRSKVGPALRVVGVAETGPAETPPKPQQQPGGVAVILLLSIVICPALLIGFRGKIPILKAQGGSSDFEVCKGTTTLHLRPSERSRP